MCRTSDTKQHLIYCMQVTGDGSVDYKISTGITYRSEVVYVKLNNYRYQYS